MTRRVVMISSLILLSCVASASSADPAVMLDDLALIDWPDVSGGTPWYSGAVAASAVLHWHANRGHPQLLPDQNGDGRIDRRDLLDLARAMGQDMGAEGEPIVDPHLVDVLARYVSDRCPGVFRLLIYDPSFPQEYQNHMGRSLDPASYQGIEIEVMDEPTHDCVLDHLEQQCPGIAGIGSTPDDNRFAVTRSGSRCSSPFLCPLGIVNTEPERFGTEAVWDTYVRKMEVHWCFQCPDWTPLETLVVLVPRTGTPASSLADSLDPPPAGRNDANPSIEHPADLAIEMKFDTPVSAGSEARYLLYIWNTGPGIARGTQVHLERPFGVGYVDSAPVADVDSLFTPPGQRRSLWILGDLPVIPQQIAGYLGAEIVSVRLNFDPSLCGQTIEFRYEITSDTQDPDLQNNSGVLQVPVLPCGGSTPPPDPGEKPNLWVTNVTACWRWSGGGDEHIVATVSGIVHNGGQASATGVQARVIAAGSSQIAYVGTVPPGGQKTVRATVDAGAYDAVPWPCPIAITADPYDTVDETDEQNNTTHASFPEASECR